MLISTQAVNISQKYSDMYLRPRNGVLLVEALSILWINIEHSPNTVVQHNPNMDLVVISNVLHKEHWIRAKHFDMVNEVLKAPK